MQPTISKQDPEEEQREGEIGSVSELQRREREGKRLFFFSLSTYLVIEADSRRHPTLNRRVCHASRNAVPCRTLLFRFQISCFVSIRNSPPLHFPHMRHPAIFHPPPEFLCPLGPDPIATTVFHSKFLHKLVYPSWGKYAGV